MNIRFKRTVSALCVLSMAAVSSVSAFAELEGLADAKPVVAYTFDDDSNKDYTLVNGAKLVDRGNADMAVSLSKDKEQYVKLTDNLTKDMKGDFTITVDVKPYTEDKWARVFDLGHGVSTDADFRNVFFTAFADTPTLKGVSGRYVLAPQGSGEEDKFKTNEWNSAAIVRKDNTGYLYINGSLRAVKQDFDLDLGFLADSDANYLGKSAYAADPYFNGEIDNFKIYDKALNSAELIKMYDRYFVDTAFIDSNGKKIFQTASGAKVTAKVKLSNFKQSDAEFTMSLVSDSGEVITDAAKTVNVASGEEGSAELAFTVPNGVLYVQLLLDINGTKYDGGYLPLSDVEFTVAEVFDEPVADPTYGAHDPTVFKDPISGKYYAYSTHNLVFESDDLIDWKKYDFTKNLTIPFKAKSFIETNYPDTKANATYWAPDLLYVEGDEYPYWFYLSCSCGLGGRNSVITLIKAKSPRIWDGEYLDEGVVLASVESKDYNTNAIDANIYTENGQTYFIWGSFWRGIHAAKLRPDGRIEGIDYTSDDTILKSSMNFGTRLFSTPNGVLGPEGPFTVHNKDNGFTYMFTSYGWLGTNYNCRIARTDKPFAEVLDMGEPNTALLDANNNTVGTSYNDQEDKTNAWGYKMIGSYNLGGITYYGNGHNSVIQADDGNWYYVEHCRKVADAAAYLQVHKMFWNKEGWPFVSPLVYSGEKLQSLPVTFVYGTWNLCSVGQTILDGCKEVSERGAARGADAPVHSCEIVIKPDGTIGGGLGTWQFDDKYTITLNFTKDGDPDKSQYFKAGDSMSLYVLTGFDEDENGGEKALVMTGTDNHNITQFAKKVSQSTSVFDNVKADSTADTVSNAKAVLTFYDENGKLTGAKLDDVELVYKDGTRTVKLNSEDTTAAKVKAAVFDAAGKLSEAVTVK